MKAAVYLIQKAVRVYPNHARPPNSFRRGTLNMKWQNKRRAAFGVAPLSQGGARRVRRVISRRPGSPTVEELISLKDNDGNQRLAPSL